MWSNKASEYRYRLICNTYIAKNIKCKNNALNYIIGYMIRTIKCKLIYLLCIYLPISALKDIKTHF